MKPTSDRRDPPDRPSLSSELLDVPPVEGRGTMPAELARLVSPHAVPRPATAAPVERTKAAPPARVEAHRPAWTGASMRPRQARRAHPRPLTHRGREVDPLWIWHPDDRRVYFDPDTYPWRCVCRVLTPSGRGSGVLIGPRHVLTASHCIDWNDLVVDVEVHRSRNFLLAASACTKVRYYTKIDQVGGDTVDEDYVVLVLEQRLGEAFGWMGCRTYHSGWDDEPFWFNIGYPTDLEEGLVPTWQRDKKLDEDELDYGGGRAMTSSADLMKGNSGGPMFGFWDGLPYVVAVVSAQGDGLLAGRENYCAGGNDLTRLVHAARADDP